MNNSILFIAKGREVLSCAPTGSGKTLAFVLPILHLLGNPRKEHFRAVVVSPTKELARQTHRIFTEMSHGKPWKVCLATKSLAHFADFSSQKYDILIATPMFLLQMMQKCDGVRLDNVKILIFDEADRLFEESFVEQIDSILTECKHPELKVSLFSATMPPLVEEAAKSVQRDPIKIIVGLKNSATEMVSQQLVYTGSEEGKLLALQNLIKAGKFQPPVLIFVQSKERAEQLYRLLIFEKLNVDVIHAERTQFQREQVVDKFRSGEVWVLITTDLMARGMDFKAVNMVINWDFPTTAVTYIHRVGRTGRAGRPGTAVTMFTDDDISLLRNIANVMKNSGCEGIPEWIFTVPKFRKSKRFLKPVERDPIDPNIPQQKELCKKQIQKKIPANHNNKQEDSEEETFV
jgi:ATP-dependent RNA helicase DDX52/ROK1